MKYMNNHYGQSRLFGHAKMPLVRMLLDAGAGTGGGGNGADGGEDGGNGAGGDGSGNESETKSFDDILKDGYQSEFDRRVQKAINTAVQNAQEKWKLETDDKLSEADKLAKMTKEQKAEYLANKREQELTNREAAITRKELMAEAKNTLLDKGMSQELADFLDYKDAASVSKSIEKLEAVFQKAVEAAVEDKIKGGKPPKKAPDGQKDTMDQEIKKAMGL